MLLKEIFSNRGLGTMIYADPHENIRGATDADIPDMLKIMRPFIKENVLIPRRRDDLEAKIADYALYEVDGTLHACGALHVFPDKSGEIASIAVDKMYANYGIGKKLVTFLLEKAAQPQSGKSFSPHHSNRGLVSGTRLHGRQYRRPAA